MSTTHGEGGTTDGSSKKGLILPECLYRELTADTVCAISLLGKRVLREYESEFILPDSTRVAVSRREITYPSDNVYDIVINLATSSMPPPLTKTKGGNNTPTRDTDSGNVTSTTMTSTDGNISPCSSDSEKIGDLKSKSEKAKVKDKCANNTTVSPKSPSMRKPKKSRKRDCSPGYRISDYLEDDAWAASMLECDVNAGGDLLRQLEAGCRLEPDGYRVERVQRRRNCETTIDLHNEPIVRTIGLSRKDSDTDSIDTMMTDI